MEDEEAEPCREVGVTEFSCAGSTLLCCAEDSNGVGVSVLAAWKSSDAGMLRASDAGAFHDAREEGGTVE